MMEPIPDYLHKRMMDTRWQDFCAWHRTAIDHPMLLNDPVLVLATIKQDFRERLEQECKEAEKSEPIKGYGR